MSSRLQVKPLFAKSAISTEHSIITKNNQTYNSYEQELETNLRTILNRYHDLDKTKVRNLLEELDNNLDLAMKILEQEMQSSNQIWQQKKAERKKMLNLTQEQQNQILKQSFLSIYKKFTMVKKENEELVKKNENSRQELAKLRYMNKLLLQGEFRQASLDQSRHIC